MINKSYKTKIKRTITNKIIIMIRKIKNNHNKFNCKEIKIKNRTI